METLALGIYVTKTTHQAAWTGTIAAAAFVPIAFFGPIGGALADRIPRKRLLMGTTVVQTALATLLAVLFAIGHPSPLTLTIIVFGNGICAGLGFPAFQAILPDLVPVEDLAGAIALSSAQYNLGRVVGPAIAGIVIAIGGYACGGGRERRELLRGHCGAAHAHAPESAAPTRARSRNCSARSSMGSVSYGASPGSASMPRRCA